MSSDLQYAEAAVDAAAETAVGAAAESERILGSLQNADSPSEIESWLRMLADTVREDDELARATIRERAISALKGKLSSPAKVVDAALATNRERDEGHDGPGHQGHVLALSEPKLWPEPVAGGELIEGLCEALRRYVILPKGADIAIALWIVTAHSQAVLSIMALLALLSPEKRCGKTTLLTVLQRLLPRPLTASSITPAALFRSVEAWQPSLLVDEADTFIKGNDELRGVLNSGHTRDTAVVVRTVGDDHEPRLFSTWCPKVVAMIGRPPDTVHDRSIVVEMRRKAPGEDVERLRLDRLDLEPLRQQAARWAADHASAMRVADPEVPDKLNDRSADNWRALLAVADLAGGQWPEKAREAALDLCGHGDREDSIRVQLLADIRDAFKDADRIATSSLLAHLHDLEVRPWGEWGRTQKPMSPHALAAQLRHFGISPSKSHGWRGYWRRAFEDAWSRYSPPGRSAPSAPDADGTRLSGESGKRPAGAAGAIAKTPENPSTAGSGADGALRAGDPDLPSSRSDETGGASACGASEQLVRGAL